MTILTDPETSASLKRPGCHERDVGIVIDIPLQRSRLDGARQDLDHIVDRACPGVRLVVASSGLLLALHCNNKDGVLISRKMLVIASAMFMSVGAVVAPDAWAGYNDFAPQPAPAPARYGVHSVQTHRGQSGLATWYGPGFHGRRTASGERFNAGAMTAAHRSLPFGTRVQVVNQTNGRSVVVRINDRGPYLRGAVIDLSRASAAAIGMAGTARVRLVSLGY